MAQTILDLFKGGKWSTHAVMIICTLALSYQISQIENQSWTVHMQAVWAQQVADHNPTNWIPNAYNIFYAVKGNHQPSGQRVAP